MSPVKDDPATSTATSSVTRSRADQLVREGNARYGRKEGSQKPGSICQTSFFLANWLLLREVERAIAVHELSADAIGPAFRALLAAMRSLEAELGEGRTRIVFYFDGPL